MLTEINSEILLDKRRKGRVTLEYLYLYKTIIISIAL